MPISINLLSESQAIEELRRRDPVKRTIWCAVFLVILLLVWSSSLWLKALHAKGELASMEAGVHSRTNEYAQVLGNQMKLREAREKLAALHILAGNRFLNGTMLDALQHATVEDVQLTHLNVQQTYTVIEGTKPTVVGKRKIPGKPPKITEHTVLTLEAKDSNPTPGDFARFKEAIANAAYFQKELTNEVRLKDLGQPTVDGSGKQFLLFSLECRYPERTR